MASLKSFRGSLVEDSVVVVDVEDVSEGVEDVSDEVAVDDVVDDITSWVSPSTLCPFLQTSITVLPLDSVKIT